VQVVCGDVRWTRSNKASQGLIEWFEVVAFEDNDALCHGLGERHKPQHTQEHP
jgi:hypothetical protein